MQLLRKVNDGSRWPNGQVKPKGLFKCPVCQAQVVRPFYAGQRFKSCGCNRTPTGSDNPNYRHGECGSAIYIVWGGMNRRCRDKRDKLYGKRGIRVCKDWHKPWPFIQWAKASGYRKGLLLDRKDNNKGYSPDNCRWVTPKESARNKRIMVLNQLLVDEIRQMIYSGENDAAIAARFGTSRQYIRAIRIGKAWA